MTGKRNAEDSDSLFRNGAKPSLGERLKRLVIGPPRDLSDRRIFHRLSLIAFLAWVGLGADGLSSSCYGPEEAFRTLREHTYLAIPLAAVMALTVLVISVAYSRVIEHFPHGGGGYIVASKLLGARAGMVSGSALLVDYVLTIAISVAAAGDALFSFLPAAWHILLLPTKIFFILLLTLLNLRGVKESVLVLTPVFLLFVFTHLVLITGGIIVRAPKLPVTLHSAGTDFSSAMAILGPAAMLLIFLHAYSLGSGTYTGIEAVSNGLPIMREPHVATGKRTMLYMAVSLAFTATGLLLCYLLWNIAPVAGKTMNAVLVERFVQVVPLGAVFVVLTMVSEGALLVVAAQAGFVDGPRVLANMAIDGWVPRRFAALSDRLTIHNGILLMAGAALAVLLYTQGDVRRLVVMYAINVFITFSLTETSMCRLYFGERDKRPDWKRKIQIHIVGLTMCLTILTVVVFEKFGEGAWLTLVVTGMVVLACLWTRNHYSSAIKGASAVSWLGLDELQPARVAVQPDLDRTLPTAVVLVQSYSSFGVQTTLTALQAFPGRFENAVFVSVGVINSGAFKGRDVIAQVRQHTEKELLMYVALAEREGMDATYRIEVGTDVVMELEKLCKEIAWEFPDSTFFAGHLVFRRERWYHAVLHNQTAFALQRRLQQNGLTLVILPIQVH